MIRNSSNIESLLLLSCLVGAVSFYCLSIAISKSLFMNSEAAVTELISQEEEIQRQIIKCEAQIDSLNLIKEYLEEELKESDRISRKHKYTSSEKQRLRLQLEQLEENLEKLEEEREKLNEQIATFLKEVPDEPKKSKLKKLTEFQKMQKELEEKIANAENKLGNFIKGNSDKNDLTSIRMEREQLIKEANKIKKSINDLKLKLLTSGTENYKRPIYFDCKSKVVKVYPGKTTLAYSELNTYRINKLLKGHDIAVLYVRPDGFSTFDELFEKVEDKSIPICYEPLAADQDLELLMSR